MTLVAAAPKEHRVLLRIALASIALLVAALVVFGLGALLAGAVPAAPKNPFGVGIREATQSSSGVGGWIRAEQAWFYRQLEYALMPGPGHSGMAFGMILLAFAYGVFHAGGPGHGKAVISAYLIANEQALRRGILLSWAAALLQALVAMGIVLTAALVLHATAIGMTRLADHVELISFAAISLFGLALTWRKAAPVAALLGFERQAVEGISRRAHGQAHRHAHDHARAHGHDAHGHDAHGHDAHEGCDHHVPLELVQGQEFRWRDAAPVVLAAGSRPCSGAIIILVFALSQGILGAGIAAVFAMASGVAITVSTLAILSVFAKQAAQRFAGREGRYALAGASLELLAAAFVALLGIGLLVTQLGASLGFNIFKDLPMIGAG
ncbi:MAG: nickel/cobalt transporter [Hyphomicrobiales bacterium]|nr:nickel/cobalt transporter [Hyphomicrobiales bacterium]